MDLIDYGKIRVDLDPLIQRIRELPLSVWTYRCDPESYETCTLQYGSEIVKPFKKELDTVLQALELHFAPGYTNRVVLSCVPAGKGILGHTDDFGPAIRASSIHCHIPLITHPSIKMGFGKENSREYHLKQGHLYSMDETLWHYVKNPSRVDRIHLLLAYFPHDGNIQTLVKEH